MSCRLETAAVGDDPTLEENHKLPILTRGDLHTRTIYAGVWAYTTFAHMAPDARNLLTSGAMVCVRYGLCGFVELDKDGDWREEATARSEFLQLPPKDTSSSESLRIALEIIIATKANWWIKNCHTGPGIMIGHVKKYTYEDFAQAAHIMGHWASTIKILSVAGIKGLRTFKALGLPGEKKLTLPRDAKLMFSLLPAGTRKLAMAYAAAVRLLESPFAGIRSAVEDFIVIPDIYTIIKETPASFHIEAQYLTGKPRADYDDLQGHLGMMPKPTMARSPRFALKKVQDYPDYAITFAKALASYRRDVGANPKEALRNLLERIEEVIQEQYDASGVPSAGGKTKGKGGDEAGETLNKHFERIDEAVQELQDALGLLSAAGKSKGDDEIAETVGNLFGSNEVVQKVRGAVRVPSAAGKSKRKGGKDENGGASSVSAAKRATIESLEPEATTSSHC